MLCLDLPRPSAAARAALWREALGAQAPSLSEVDLLTLVNGFRFTGCGIRAAAAAARDIGRWRAGPDGGQGPAPGDLLAACRLHASQGLSTLGQKVVPRAGWSDLVLPEERMQQLRELVNGMKFRHVVHERWGFGERLSLGKGLAVLFAGPSGTGKTMAAEVIAGELGLDLFKIDLSAVVSKYIGETEKNLARIFAEAETCNAILFFDEADALFGKRSEVRDAHDRYANIETAYLLQRLEAYEGLVILATNLKKNMDEAFVRRLALAVEFPLPGEADRRRIWHRIFPRATPLQPGLDLDGLGRRFEFSGGNIRNVALAAAFLAAADGGVVGMPHILRASQREFQKMGRVGDVGELG